MKLFFVAVLIGASIYTMADHHDGENTKSFEEKKSMMLKYLDNRLTQMNEAKKCTVSAKDEKSLKACREQMRKHRKEAKKKFKGKD